MSKQKRVETRYAWIEASLRYVGKFDKVSYGRHFEINPPQISADQSGFVEAFNDELSRGGAASGNGPALDICKGKIRLLHDLPEETVFDIPDLRAWLQSSSTIPYVRLYDYSQVDPDPKVLRAICESILHETPLRILLVGTTDGKWRNLSPHAIIDIDGRLYIRAYEHERLDFSEFPIAMIADTGRADRGICYVGQHLDRDWIEETALVIEADPASDPARTEVAISDFGLDPEDLARRIHAPRALRYHLETRLRCRAEVIADRVGKVKVRSEEAV